jgi:hypothetical protein
MKTSAARGLDRKPIVGVEDGHMKVRCMSQEHCIRKVKVLQGRAKDAAEKQGLGPDDLVIVTTSVHPLPEYHIEKIDGDPVSFLLKQVEA